MPGSAVLPLLAVCYHPRSLSLPGCALIMKTGGAAAKVEVMRHSLWFLGTVSPTVSLLVCPVSQGTQA